jgi:hypothetical protein
MDIREYGSQAEAFLASLNEEYYRYGCGLKGDLELNPIYQRHCQLFDVDTVRALVDGRQSREGRYLAQFGAAGFVESQLREITERIAAAESSATIEWDGQAVPYLSAGLIESNEPDRARRRELDQRIARVTERLITDGERRLLESHRATAELMFDDYVTMSDELGGLRLASLRESMQLLLTQTASIYRELLERRLRAAGVELEEATSGDFSFIRRGTRFDSAFPKERLVLALETTLAGLGIVLADQSCVSLDLEERPLKSPRAFCAPVWVPNDVRLAVRPRGGHEDYLSLFHEAGHLEHFAHTNPDAPVAFRCLGDTSVTEAYAFLFDKLPRTPEWVRAIMDDVQAADYLSLSRLIDLYYVRRTAAKLTYELDLHRSNKLDGMRDRYRDLLGAALGLRVRPENFLRDVDDFFYCAHYLRAWMLEVQLRRRLIEQFGRRWFASPKAGEFLRNLWSLGQTFTADELALRLGYQGLGVEPLVADLLSPV